MLSKNKKGKLIILSGPSGSGKSSICNAIREKMPELFWSVSATTRSQKTGEIDGKDYYFISESEFLSKLEKGEFLEYAKVHGFYYGTPLKPIEDMIASGHSCLLDIDVQGAWKIRQQNKYDLILIFIEPPSLKELELRLIKRGRDTLAQIQKRIQNATEEIKMSYFYEHRVVNDKLEEAIEKILAILTHQLA